MNISLNGKHIRAFTIIELLVVISIIGLLSSVILVSLQGARAKAVNAHIQQSVGQVRNALEIGRTGAGYSWIKAGTNGIAYYNDLSADIKAVVTDTLKQQGLTVAGGYPGGDVACSTNGLQTVDSTTGVVITTNNTTCSTPTEYAIYSALKPVGSAGYICVDSKGGKASDSVGGIVLNPSNGVCSGTVGGVAGPSISVDISTVFVASVRSFSWTSSGATSCSLSSNPSEPVEGSLGPIPTSGTITPTWEIDNYNYEEDGINITITCSNGASSGSDTVIIGN